MTRWSRNPRPYDMILRLLILTLSSYLSLMRSLSPLVPLLPFSHFLPFSFPFPSLSPPLTSHFSLHAASHLSMYWVFSIQCLAQEGLQRAKEYSLPVSI